MEFLRVDIRGRFRLARRRGSATATLLLGLSLMTFTSVIVPELQSQDVNGYPMLKAGALKFFTMFRAQMQKPLAFQLFPDLVRWLESEENQYVMKCMMRVLGIADISNEIAGPCFSWLTSILNEQIFLLLFPDSWKRSSNVPALVRLLEAFIQKAPHELNQEGRLNQVLGIFNMLVSSSSTAEQGFYELNTVIENLEYGVISPYMNNFWKFLFMRLQNQSYCKVSEVSCDFHVTLFGQAWGSKFSGHNECSSGQHIVSCLGAVIECTLAAAASTRLVCESPVLLDAAAA
ncbi:hypothetical protein Goklo_019980 [Gossypium klotzschianum]|uniref:Uncharacterized protein n=1 Tax=Gossypium klotzschianum TaxID=34286 RepID=A0A7J8UQT9_9ROSI|nr:hypothetical protein [Gossypium klotzschianum]